MLPSIQTGLMLLAATTGLMSSVRMVTSTPGTTLNKEVLAATLVLLTNALTSTLAGAYLEGY